MTAYRKAAICFAMIMMLALSLIACTPESSHTDTEPHNDYVSMVKCPVIKGEIASTFAVTGTVSASEQAIIIYKIEGIEDPAPFYDLMGKKVQCGDILYKDVAFTANGEIVNVAYSKNVVSVTLLDCSELYITSLISYDQYTQLDYSTPVTVIFDGDKYPAKIQSIGYTFENNMTQLQVACENDQFRPGLEVELCFTSDVRENGLYIPYEALFQNGDQPCVKILDADKIRTVNVVCGEIFESESDGHVWKYVELLSGVQDGDVVIFEVLEGSLGSHIYEEFIQ